MSIGRKRVIAPAPASTALYPATVAWEESTSIFWARVILGISSTANAVTPRSASASMAPGGPRGSRWQTSMDPDGSRAISSRVGG